MVWPKHEETTKTSCFYQITRHIRAIKSLPLQNLQPPENISRLGKSKEHKQSVYPGVDPCDFIEEMWRGKKIVFWEKYVHPMNLKIECIHVTWQSNVIQPNGCSMLQQCRALLCKRCLRWFIRPWLESCTVNSCCEEISSQSLKEDLREICFPLRNVFN